MTEKSNIIIHAAIGKSLDDKLTDYCTSTDRTKSYVTRLAIERMFQSEQKKALNKNWAFRESGNVSLKNDIQKNTVEIKVDYENSPPISMFIDYYTFECLISAIKSI